MLFFNLVNKTIIFLIVALIFCYKNILATDPYDNDLRGKRLICFADSDSIDDWGVKFLENKGVILYSLDKFIYEIFQYSRTYRTDLRNIMIFKGSDIEYTINRKSLKFGNKTILDSLNLNLNNGQILGLLGPNGSGKTTLFNLITGLISPDYGSIFINSFIGSSYSFKFLVSAKLTILAVTLYAFLNGKL